MRVGAGNATILFSEELLPVEGFIGIHDLPKVGVVLLQGNDTKMALVSIEIVMLWDDFIDKCRNTAAGILDVPKENVWIHVTHAISTPHAPGGPLVGLGGNTIGKVGVDDNKRKVYEGAIYVALIDALMEATHVRNATLLVGSGKCDLIRGRDVQTPEGWWIGIDGDGPSNETMTIISLVDEVGNYIANLISYGMKPCVIDNAEMDKGTRMISADAPGLMCRLLEKHYNAPTLYFTAAAGDRVPVKTAWFDHIGADGKIMTTDLGVKKGLEFANELAAEMTVKAIEIIDNSKEESVQDIIIKQTEYEWPTKGRIEMHPYKELTFESNGRGNVPVGLLSLGNVAFVSSKPEINVITEYQLQQQSDYEHTLYISMVNGGMKYMPDWKSYDELRWEALNSMLMPGAAEKFVEEAIKLMGEE